MVVRGNGSAAGEPQALVAADPMMLDALLLDGRVWSGDRRPHVDAHHVTPVA